MSKLNFAIFLVGATVGAVGAWFFVKKHYEQIAQQEIDSVKAVFAERKPEAAADPKTDTQKTNAAKLKPDLIDYAAKIKEHGYANYTDYSKKTTKEKDKTMADKPYPISPEEFGEFDDYIVVSLIYFSDGVLTDDMEEVIDDIEETVGSDFAEHFGEYEDDSVFIRNDRLKCDYEILRDNRTYGKISED